MPLNPGVRIELTVDSMKHHMVQYLTEHAIDLPAMVEIELDRVLRDPGPIAEALSQQIARDLQAKIGEEIKSAISGIWYRTELREKLQSAMTEAIRESIRKSDEWRNRA